jgi:hypothetical protein
MIFQKVGWEVMDWISLAEDRNSSRALVNAIPEPSGSINTGNFFVAEHLLASQERLCSLELVIAL